jgi:hypothetical protein
MALLGAATAQAAIEIRTTPECSSMQRLAAKEVVRYLYLRIGSLPEKIAQDGRIVIADKAADVVSDAATKAAAKDLQPQQYMIRTTTTDGKKTWWIVGGDDVGTLYGAYRFAERLGVRFYLHGDVVPDERLAAIPDVEDVGRPLFALRGVNPWGSHPFGFDAWSTDDYKAIFTQLAKMRMNFLGIHCYPEGQPYAEPTVWHGLPGDFDAQGRVRFSYASRYFNTLLTPAWGGYVIKKTGDYSFGGALLFDRDEWAPPVLAGHCPLPVTPDACNEVFNRMAGQFREAFGFARQLGIKTCIGTEAPLVIPKAVRDRLAAQGKNPGDPTAVRDVYEGTFRRIMASHPLDYYWIWTPESWRERWTPSNGNTPEQYRATIADIELAIEALKNTKASFKLAMAGWVLGPANDRAAFDKELPKDVPLSALTEDMGHLAVTDAFSRISGREKWAIPWLESDDYQGLAGLQLFAGRIRREAADTLAYGCTGLMGLQWRTDIVGPNVAALAQAAWDQAGWNPTPGKLPPEAIVPLPADGPLGGVGASYVGQEIRGGTDPVLYQTCRYNFDGYNLKVPNGRYRVTLGFCEPHFDKSGQRIGDFKLQGETVVAGLDVFARVGKFAALDLAFDNIEVTDGCLRLRIEARQSWPCISSIVIEGTGFVRKINCGGPAYKDYEADLGVADIKSHSLPCGDLYADWAAANFGREAVGPIGRLFASIDGKVPCSVAPGCPSGAMMPDTESWQKVSKQYAFVDELASLRSQVMGPGNLDRFDWWLNTFRYHRSLHQVRCTLGEFETLLQRKETEAAVAKYKELLALYGETYRLLLATVNSPGGLATIVNLENHSQFWPVVVEGPAQKLEAALGQPLPDDAKPTKTYQGRPRIIVPTVRALVRQQESLNVKFIVLDRRSPASVTVAWRPLGDAEFRKVSAQHIARAVYEVALPPAAESLEYRIEVATAAGESLVWPTTAPTMNQTVVAW